MPVRVPWKLTDLSTGTPQTVEFVINPVEADYPGRKARIVEESGTSPSSGAIIFQGKDEQPKIRFSGAVRDEAWYTELQTWANKWYPLILEDDLGMSWTVIIEEFSPTRIRRPFHPWRFDVEIVCRVV